MKKFRIDYTQDGKRFFDTYQEAEDALKRTSANDTDSQWTIWQAIANAKVPVPEIEVVKL